MLEGSQGSREILAYRVRTVLTSVGLQTKEQAVCPARYRSLIRRNSSAQGVLKYTGIATFCNLLFVSRDPHSAGYTSSAGCLSKM